MLSSFRKAKDGLGKFKNTTDSKEKKSDKADYNLSKSETCLKVEGKKKYSKSERTTYYKAVGAFKNTPNPTSYSKFGERA